MGIFDTDDAEPTQVAQHVYGDLLSFIKKTHPQKLVDAAIEEANITVSSSAGRSLLIVCDGPDAFRLKENVGNLRGGVQTQVTSQTARWSLSEQVPRSRMIERVKRWLSEP
jgi:hypothetical protein